MFPRGNSRAVIVFFFQTSGWALDYNSVVGHGICTVTQLVSFSRKKRENRSANVTEWIIWFTEHVRLQLYSVILNCFTKWLYQQPSLFCVLLNGWYCLTCKFLLCVWNDVLFFFWFVLLLSLVNMHPVFFLPLLSCVCVFFCEIPVRVFCLFFNWVACSYWFIGILSHIVDVNYQFVKTVPRTCWLVFDTFWLIVVTFSVKFVSLFIISDCCLRNSSFLQGLGCILLYFFPTYFKVGDFYVLNLLEINLYAER